MMSRLATTTADFEALLLADQVAGLPFSSVQWLSALLLIVTTAVVARLVVREIRLKPRPVLILGSGALATKIMEELEAAPALRYCVAGIVDVDAPEPGTPQAGRWLGSFERLAEIVGRVQPERIVLAASDRRGLPMQLLLESRVRGIVVEDAAEFYERLTGKIAIEAIRPSVLIMAKGFRNHGAAEILARLVSMAVAAIATVLVAPLLAALAIAVKLNSRGPVFFVQERAGRDGRPFGLVKFRTMHPSDEPRSEWVMDNLDRITSLGRWLRRFRLDELPQLLNVLRGEMNLVGPRPHPTSNHAVFMERIAYYGLRSSVRPGVTGWAQVRYGYANNLEEETEKMRYDLYYIRNRSLWMDARILFETIGIMLFGKGASEVRRPSPSRSELLPPSPRHKTESEPAYVRLLAKPTPASTSAGRR